jgi:hypothetical protein
MMTVNRERGRVWREVATVDLDYETLAQAVVILEGYRAQYGDAARIQKRDYEYGDGEYWAVMQERDETDKEMLKRVATEEKRESEKADRERADFERLKLKFGGQ